jgi:hypothetical protein
MTVVGNPCIKKVEDSGEITDFYKFPKNIFGSFQLPLGLHASVDGTIIISSASLFVEIDPMMDRSVL